jgi:hypothetical protein
VDFVEKKEEKLQLIVLGKTKTKKLLGKWWRPLYVIQTYDELYLNTNWIEVQYLLIQYKFYSMSFNMIKIHL